MADAADMDALARRYLDLWQEHLNAVAGDRETTDVIARTMALMSSGAQMFAAAAQPNESSEGTAERDPAPDTNEKTGTSTVAAASGDPNPDHAQLLERIAALEERLAKLESGAATSRRGARRGARKHRS